MLAIIGDRTISIGDFISRYQQINEKMNLPDNGQVRKKTFRNMIDEELIRNEAIQRGFQDDSAGKYEKERLQIQELLNAYLQNAVLANIQINEKELRKLYIQLNKKIKARHLYASSRNQADSIYAEVMMGKSFEELAKEIFEDPQLRDTGGSLGYFSVDEMDPYFEEAAFALDIGQISKPVRTAQGYSIIQVQDRIVKPLLTESEYTKHRDNLEQYWRSRRTKKASRSYVDSLRQQLDITFYKPVVLELLQSIKNRAAVPTPEEASYFSPDDEKLNHKELVYSKLGVWDVKTLLQYAQFTSEGQLKWIRNEENLEDFIAGIVVRAYMLSRARELGFDKSETYRSDVNQKMDNYLLIRMEKTIADEIIIPDDTLRTYFQKNKDQFVVPPRVHLSEIVLDDESKIQEIEKQLQKNIPFEVLAKTNSVNRRSAAHNGEIGSFTVQDLGPYADQVFQLETGQWAGPIKVDNQFAFIKCIGKDSQKPLSFDEARSEIEAILFPKWKRKAKQKLLATLRQQIKIVTYPEKLKTIQII